MGKVEPLLRTPRPHKDESLRGLVVRATEENGYYSSSLLLSLMNVRVDTKTNRILYTEQRLRNLSKSLNVDIPTLQEMACLSGIEEIPPQAYNVFGHRIHKYSVRVGAPKVCPGCLRERNYIRRIWDIAAFTCCPKHRTLLIEKCPKCGKKILWSRDKVSVCACGQDWREVDLPEVSEAETVLSRLILQVCGLWESSETVVKGTCKENTSNPLSSVGLSELLCAVYFIAGQQHGVVDATGKHYAVKLPHKELHEVLTNAVSVFENWPENYFKFLEECRGRHYKGGRHSGLYRDFGKFYDPLFIRKDNPLPNFMREAFKRYITTVWDGGYAGWCGSISDEELKNKKYMTRYEVTKYLRVSLMTVNRLHRKGQLRGFYLPWVNRSRIMIEADSVRELKDRWDKAINATHAGEMLGIGRIAVVSLVKSGCLNAIQGPAVTGQLEWKFEVSAIEKLLYLVERKITEEKQGTGVSNVSFYKAIQKLSKLSIEVGDFVKLILDGKITPIAKGIGIGLSSLLFNAFEIRRFSQTESVERRGDKCTMVEAARLLRMANDEIVFLIKKGFLSADKLPGGRGGIWSIAQNEIDRFKNTYSTVGYIVDALGTSTKGLAKRLISNGITPVTGPKVDGGERYIFKKADLDAVDPSAILPKTPKSTMQKMNEKGLISKKQLADITGYDIEWINKVVGKGWIVPAVIHRHKDGNVSSFFSHEQIQKFKELMAEEKRQLILFYDERMDMRLAA